MTPLQGGVEIFLSGNENGSGIRKSLSCRSRKGFGNVGSRLRLALDVLPAALGCRGEDSIAYFRGFEGIPESRIAGFATAERGEEIRNLMNEGVFVADTETRNPPFVEIGVVTITDMDAAPASDHALVRVIEILEAIEIVKIPPDGRILAVDFERVEGLVSPGVTG